MNIAIDGPGGAGKSSVARAVAARLGFVYIDTGAMYRALALLDMRDWRFDSPIYPEDLRTPEAAQRASKLSALPETRTYLLQRQRDLAARCDCVLEGRDIGTVVLPDAEVKIFLTASPETRAERRMSELREKGVDTEFEKTLAEINERDERDTNRTVAPLRQAEGAVLVDTSDMTLEEVIDKIEEIVKLAM